MLNFCLPALEEVESIGGFGVYMLHYRKDVKNILFCESGLVPVVKVVLLQQDLEGPKRVEGTVITSIGTWQEKGQNSKRGFTVKHLLYHDLGQNSARWSDVGVHHHMYMAKWHRNANTEP